MSDNTISVIVTGRPVCEDGKHYKKGDTFEVTPSRAKALAGFVSVFDSGSEPEPGANDEQPDEAAPVKGKKK